MIPAFANLSQRVVYSYQRQLSELVSVMPPSLSPSEHPAMVVSQQQLYDFFRAFYAQVYKQPERFGLPATEDLFTEPGDGREKKQDVAKKTKKLRVKMGYGPDFLQFVGQQGTLHENHLQLGKQTYDTFFAKGSRVKRKFFKGMETVGLIISEQDDTVVVSNSQFPQMMLALKTLAEACEKYSDKALAKFLFACCDFRMLNDNYQPDTLDMLRTVVSLAEFEHAVELHRILGEMAYQPRVRIGSVFDWRIQYQGKRAIKSTPFFEYDYDDRTEPQLTIKLKCASVNRLLPLLGQQPASLQEDFFQNASVCSGCGWCKTRKALGPSVLKHNGEKKIICWLNERQFTKMDADVVDLVRQYALFHEELAKA